MALTDVLSGAAALGKSLLRPSRALDVVAITGGGYGPMFPDCRPLVATVFEDARLMEHPLETGAVIADHIVFEPTEIELPCRTVGEVAYRNTYAALKMAFLQGTLLTVMTRTGVYDNMVIVSMPHDERPDAFNAIEMNIRLRHAVFVQPQSTELPASKTTDPKQSSTVKKGAQQTTPASTPKAASATAAARNSGTANTPAAGAAAGSSAAPRGSTLYRWAYGDA